MDEYLPFEVIWNWKMQLSANHIWIIAVHPIPSFPHITNIRNNPPPQKKKKKKKKKKPLTFHNKKFGQRKVDLRGQLLDLSAQFPLWKGSEPVKERCNVVRIDSKQQLKMSIHGPFNAVNHNNLICKNKRTQCSMCKEEVAMCVLVAHPKAFCLLVLRDFSTENGKRRQQCAYWYHTPKFSVCGCLGTWVQKMESGGSNVRIGSTPQSFLSVGA